MNCPSKPLAPLALTILPLLAVLAGCGTTTPTPVLDLAEKSSANVGVVSARLRQLSDQSDSLFADRAANVARLNGATTSKRAAMEYDLALTRKTGQEADLALMRDLQAWTADVDRIFATAAGAEKARNDELLAAKQKIDTRTQALDKVAQTLSALAQQESAGDRAKLLAAFAGEVRSDVKKQLEDGSEASKAAKDLLDKLKSKP